MPRVLAGVLPQVPPSPALGLWERTALPQWTQCDPEPGGWEAANQSDVCTSSGRGTRGFADHKGEKPFLLGLLRQIVLTFVYSSQILR